MNMEFPICSFLIFLLMNAFISELLASRFCRTARNEFGECKDIYSCPHMKRIMNWVLRSPKYQYKIYLQRSQCTKEDQSQTEMFICCPYQPLPLLKGTIHLIHNSVLTDDCRKEPSTNQYGYRMAHGTPAKIGEYPWMALLEYNKPGNERCAGNIISERYILTAAHCVSYKILSKNLKIKSVRLGEYDLSRQQDNINNVVTIDVERTIIHHRFECLDENCVNDIALLRLARLIRFTHYIKPICLPRNAKIEQWLFAAGWGRMENGVNAEKKMKIEIPLFDFDSCKKKFENRKIKLGYGQFCAGGERGGKDTCDGDSGGPIMAEMKVRKNSEWILFGITSFGNELCGELDIPGVYTKVYDFMPWILRHLKP